MPGGMPQIEILLPTAAEPGDATSPTYDIGALDGVVVGLRTDRSWRSYYAVVDVWEKLLHGDGADVRVLWAGDRAGPQGEQTRADVEEWARLIECGVIGLGN